MTKQDYEVIARAMYHAHPGARARGESMARWQQWEATVQQLVIELSADNSRFDAQKFRTYCLNGFYV